MTTKYYQQKNKEIIDEIVQTKTLAKSTKNVYTHAVASYSASQNMTMQELLDEADEEEEQRIRMKKRKIKKRMINYKEYLIQEKKETQTINSYLSKIKSLYRFFEIEVPTIPPLIDTTHELIEDIPNKKHIRIVLETTNNLRVQALILFMSSSGTSVNETSSLTIQNFIDATKDYHNESSIINVIHSLEVQEAVVPTFQLYRQKTHYPYITFCTPEATQKILQMLKNRIYKNPDLSKDEPLFFKQTIHVNKHFIRLNDKLGWGRKRNHAFFHPHGLRKFFATELLKSDMDSMTIDFLSGRAISKTHQAYFKADPQKLKNKYMQFMDNLMINEKLVYKDVTSKELKELEYYREKDKARDKKLQELEKLLMQYVNLQD